MQRKFSIHTTMISSKCVRTLNLFLILLIHRFSFGFRERSFPNIEVSGMSISQAIDAPITTRDTISMSGSLSSQNGNAQGINGYFS